MKLREERQHRLKLRYDPTYCDIGETLDSKTKECVIRHELTSKGSKCPLHEVFAQTGKWKSNGKKHFVESENCVPPVYLSTGNSKVGEIPTFSLPAVVTCPGSTQLCRKHCYACKNEGAFRPGVKPRRYGNFWASKQPEFVDWITKELIDRQGFIEKIPFTDKATGKHYKGVVRIHESGDFYNQEYQKKWYDIAERFPDYLFYAYTTMCDWDWKKDKPGNFRIRCSVWPDTKPEKVESWREKGMDLAIVEDPSKPVDENFEFLEGMKVHQCPSRTAAVTGKPKKQCDKCRFCLGSTGSTLFVKEPSVIPEEAKALYKKEWRTI